MKRADAQSQHARLDWLEALALGFGLGLPGVFNIEWLIDRAERGEWSGIWW